MGPKRTQNSRMLPKRAEGASTAGGFCRPNLWRPQHFSRPLTAALTCPGEVFHTALRRPLSGQRPSPPQWTCRSLPSRRNPLLRRLHHPRRHLVHHPVGGHRRRQQPPVLPPPRSPPRPLRRLPRSPAPPPPKMTCVGTSGEWPGQSRLSETRGCPVQAPLERGFSVGACTVAVRNIPARSRLRAVHCDSISPAPISPVA